jgi:hypothetical protein
MDIFHFFIVIPQLTAASVPDELLKRCFHGQPVWALAVADVSLFVAGLCTLRVRLAEWLSAYSGCLMLFPQQLPRATAAINPLIKHHDPRRAVHGRTGNGRQAGTWRCVMTSGTRAQLARGYCVPVRDGCRVWFGTVPRAGRPLPHGSSAADLGLLASSGFHPPSRVFP